MPGRSTRPGAASATGVVIDPPSLRLHAAGRARLVLRAARRVGGDRAARASTCCARKTGRAWRAIHGREAVAEALGIHVPCAKLSAFVVSCTLTSVAGCLFAYYRGFVSAEAFSLFVTIQYVATVIIGGIGSLLGALLGTLFVVLFPYAHRGADERARASTDRLSSMIFADQLRRVRRRDDPVPGVRAAGAGRHLAAGAGLVPAVAVQAEAARPMNDERAAQLENVEVTYHRVSHRRAGRVARRAAKGRSSRCSAPTAPARPRRCARSRASSASTMRGSPRARSRYQGERIENWPPHEITRARHHAGARAQQGVREPDAWPRTSRPRAAARRRARRRPTRCRQYFPALAAPARARRRLPVGRRAADAGDWLGADVRAAAAAGRRAVAGARAAGGARPDRPAAARSAASSA